MKECAAAACSGDEQDSATAALSASAAAAWMAGQLELERAASWDLLQGPWMAAHSDFESAFGQVGWKVASQAGWTAVSAAASWAEPMDLC